MTLLAAEGRRLRFSHELDGKLRDEGAESLGLLRMSMLGSLCIIVLMIIANSPVDSVHTAGLLLILMSVHTLSRLRCGSTAATPCLIVLAEEVRRTAEPNQLPSRERATRGRVIRDP